MSTNHGQNPCSHGPEGQETVELDLSSTTANRTHGSSSHREEGEKVFTLPSWHLVFLNPRDSIVSYTGSHVRATLTCVQWVRLLRSYSSPWTLLPTLSHQPNSGFIPPHRVSHPGLPASWCCFWHRSSSCHKGVVSFIHKELLEVIKKRTINSIEKMVTI